MSIKNAQLKGIVLLVILSACAVPAMAQTAATPDPSQVDLGDIRGAVVTLYYYDAVNETKGAIVSLPDNPQEVAWDYTKSAPGTYTYTYVPEGVYYLEAVHNNHSWFAIVTVNATLGTSTANVAIPPYNDSYSYPSLSPAATLTSTPTAVPTATPASTPAATPSPGMSTLCALTGITLVALYVARKHD